MITLLALGQTACVVQAPTISHVHVGHSVTAALDTQDNQGYFVLAERRQQAALDAVRAATKPGQSLTQVHNSLTALNDLVNLRRDYPLTAAIQASASHIRFAARSNDATENVRTFATNYEAAVEGVLYRNDLIDLYIKDALDSNSIDEITLIAQEVAQLVQNNLGGEDLDDNGYIGNAALEHGTVQLRRDLDAMIAREQPPYATVDRWYLFNLIRLPSGDWIFRKSDSGKGPGY